MLSVNNTLAYMTRNIKKSGRLFRDRIGERYQFIDTEKKTFPISLMWDVLDELVPVSMAAMRDFFTLPLIPKLGILFPP